MRLVVLGSGVVEPTLHRGSSSYALEIGNDLVLLDMGSGALKAAMRAGLDPRRARHVVLSHLHPDHTADLVPLLFAFNYAEAWKPRHEITFAGPDTLPRFLEDLEVPFPWLRPKGWTRRTHVGSLEAPGWRATPYPVEHGSTKALAWRFETPGRTICYSGDTSYCEGLLEAARDADLLLVECSHPRSQPKVEGHLDTDDVGRVAAESGAKRVVLTHLYPIADEVDVVAEVRERYEGPVEKAQDGCSY